MMVPVLTIPYVIEMHVKKLAEKAHVKLIAHTVVTKVMTDAQVVVWSVKLVLRQIVVLIL